MESQWLTRRHVRDLRPGDHGWLAYADDVERRLVVGAFVRDGLTARDKIIYLADRKSRALPGPADLADRGLLTVVPLEESRGSGGFEPNRVVDALAGEIAEAEREGRRGVRVITDLGWALDRPSGPELLADCERRIDRAVGPSTQVIALCHLDGRGRGPAELARLRDEHSVLVRPDPEFEDGVLRITRTFQPPGLTLGGEVDADRHRPFREALSSMLAGVNGSELHLDLSELGFIDLAGLDLLAEIAGDRALPLVLDRIPGHVRAVIDTIGWHMLPGLRPGLPGEPGLPADLD